eukprot:scaffold12454_cov80-Cyclotella_meneghiniana.AAC.5
MSSTSQARKRKRGLDALEGDIECEGATDEPVESTKRRSRRRGANTPEDDTPVAQPNESNAVIYSSETSHKQLDGQRPLRQLKGNTSAKDSPPKSSLSRPPLGLFCGGGLESKTLKATQPLPPIDGGTPSVLDESSNNMYKESNDDGECDDYKYLTDNCHQTSRTRYLRIAALIFSVSNFLALITLSSVLYTLDFNHKFELMQKKSMHVSIVDKYNTLYEESVTSVNEYRSKLWVSQQSNEQLKGAMAYTENELSQCQQMNGRLKEAMVHIEADHNAQIEEYKSIFKQHDNDMNEALSRIKVLRGDKEDKTSALDMAWQRMDELLEENNELSHHLSKAKNHQHFVARDRELINTVESLTQQLITVSDEKNNLSNLCDDLNTLLNLVNKEYELLEFTHQQIAGYLSQVLSYVKSLHCTARKQHGIILELTSLVHSLHSSLELSESNAQVQTTESIYAIDALATAAGQMVSRQTAQYEMERTHYMEHMERKLTRMEDEALGAVQAVAAAAGKLEYERKIEEENRWRSYIEEVERTLSDLTVQTDNDLLSQSQNEAGSNGGLPEEESPHHRRQPSDIDEIIEKSVLRAAISRRIEEGIASLQKYIHPYNYLKEKKSYQWEIKSEEPEK